MPTQLAPPPAQPAAGRNALAFDPPPPPAPAKPPRVDAIQGLRAVAALAVFTVHFGNHLGWLLGTERHCSPVVAVVTGCRVGTDLFFAISAFLVYGMAVRRPVAVGPFLAGRVRRLYPAFACVLGVWLLLALVVPGWSPDAVTAADLARNLTLTAGLTGDRSLVYVTWSLAFELALYVTVPLAVGLTGMRDWPRRRRVAALLGAGGAYALLTYPLDPVHIYFARPGVYFVGFLAYEAVAWRAGRPSARGELAAVGLAAATLGAAGLLSPAVVWGVLDRADAPALRLALVWTGTFAVAWACFGAAGTVGRLLAWRPLVWAGGISYSVYLVHPFVLGGADLAARAWLPPLVGGPPAAWAVLLFAAGYPALLGLTVAAAVVLYRVAEEPFMAAKPAAPRADVSQDTARTARPPDQKVKGLRAAFRRAPDRDAVGSGV